MNGPEPTSRTVVKPASSVVRAFFSATKPSLYGCPLEVVDRVVLVGARAQVGVAVDQARKHSRLRQVDDLGSAGNLRRNPPGSIGLDAFAFDDDDNVLAIVVAGGVEETAGADIGSRRLLRAHCAACAWISSIANS